MFIKKEYLISLAIGAIAILVIAFIIPKNVPSLGNVAKGNDYQSKNLSLITTTTPTLLATGQRTLGSVIFATTSDRTFTIYNVAAAANYSSTTLSTKLISFATGTPAGTYTYDLSATRGIAVDAPVTSTKETVITFR